MNLFFWPLKGNMPEILISVLVNICVNRGSICLCLSLSLCVCVCVCVCVSVSSLCVNLVSCRLYLTKIESDAVVLANSNTAA